MAQGPSKGWGNHRCVADATGDRDEPPELEHRRHGRPAAGSRECCGSGTGSWAAFAGSDVAQLSAWARIRWEASFTPLYLMAHLDGRLVGGALVLERRLPVVGRIGYVSNGPLLSGTVPREPVVDHSLSRWGNGSHPVRRCSSNRLSTGRPLAAGCASGVPGLSAGIAPAASIRIDLHQTAEDLHGGLTRANRRRAATGKVGTVGWAHLITPTVVGDSWPARPRISSSRPCRRTTSEAVPGARDRRARRGLHRRAGPWPRRGAVVYLVCGTVSSAFGMDRSERALRDGARRRRRSGTQCYGRSPTGTRLTVSRALWPGPAGGSGSTGLRDALRRRPDGR